MLESLLERASVSQPLRAALAAYGRLVLEANRTFNLTGAKSAEELVPHLLDSLTILPYLIEPYVDIGSGAGFPAIPAALASGMAVTMIEATAKKAEFLRSVSERLRLGGRVVAERAELAARRPDLREQFSSGTARALARSTTMAELLLPFIAPGGVAICQLGYLATEERRGLDDASFILGGRLESEHSLTESRRILIVRKERSTPARYPRQNGIPAKRPLCS